MLRRKAREKKKAHPLFGYLGDCPRCGMANAEMDVLNWTVKRRRHHKVQCRRCGYRFSRFRAVKKRWRPERRRHFLPGSRRTIWSNKDVSSAMDYMTDVLNMPLPSEAVERRLRRYFDEQIAKKKWTHRQLDGLLVLASRRCLYSSSDFIKERFDSLFMDKPCKMLGRWDERRLA